MKKAAGSNSSLGLVKRIEHAVLSVRGHNVMLDTDLAALYHVDVKALNQAVKRNRDRFPADFMFRLTDREARTLRSQIVTAKIRRGGRRTAPYAFTEQGVAMLSSVLRSQRAVSVNIAIMRVRSSATNARVTFTPREETRRVGGEIRHAVHRGIRGDS